MEIRRLEKWRCGDGLRHRLVELSAVEFTLHRDVILLQRLPVVAESTATHLPSVIGRRSVGQDGRIVSVVLSVDAVETVLAQLPAVTTGGHR